MANRGNPNWVKGGASPNPTGMSKKVAALRKALEADGPKAHKVIARALDSADESIAMDAAKIVLKYTLPEPAKELNATVKNGDNIPMAERWRQWREAHPLEKKP